MFPKIVSLSIIGSLSALGGFLLVIAGAILVIIESSYAQRQLDAELLDVPELARQTGQHPGKVREKEPRDIANVKG